MKKVKKAFTLVELLIVIAVIAILAAVVAPNAFKAIEKSKVSAVETDYKAIKTATLSYYSDTGSWPLSNAAGNDPGFAVTTAPEGVTGWNGPYMEKWPTKNPWGGKYIFNNGNGVGAVGIPTGALVNHSYKFITLTSVNSAAVDKLEADLDGGTASGTEGIVRYDPANKTTVYLIISEQ